MPGLELALPILGIISSLFGSSQQSSAASGSNELARGQLDLARRAQDYGFARQAQVDPLFTSLLSQFAGRAQGAPRMFGRRRGVPLSAGLEGRRTELPAPKLIGS